MCTHYNFIKNTEHYLLQKSLAGWPFAMNETYVENLTRYLDNPYFQVIADIVDLYCINLTVVKRIFIISI